MKIERDVAASSFPGSRLDEAGRRTVLTGLLVALAGSSVGLLLSLWFGPAASAEAFIIASCAGMALLLILLLIKRNPVSPRQAAAAASVYFTLYLPAGTAAAIWDSSQFSRIVPYLLWYYPLLAFSKFTTSGRLRAVLDSVISVSPPVLLIAYFAVHGQSADAEVFILTWSSLAAFLAYAIFLSRFSGYREAIADRQARAEEALKAAEALEESEISYQRILSDAGAGIGMMNREEIILWGNDKLGEWSGRETVSGLKFGLLTGGDEMPALRAGISRVLKGEIPKFDYEGSIQAPGERPRVIQFTFLQAPGRDAQPEAIVFICFDVTELRELDSQLRQSQKMQALGRLTGGIAHDFNNLLTVILGSSEALTYRLAGRAEEQELAEVIEEAAERASGLVRHLLAFSQKQALAPSPCDVRELIDNAVALMKRVLPESIQLDVRDSPEVGLTLIDPGQFEAALLNLVVNARDAMPRGGHIRLAAKAVSLPGPGDYPPLLSGNYVLVMVSDEGEGIGEDTLARVFEPFFTTKGAGQGSGLGLSMVYGFIKQSGGEVQIVSRKDVGTEVRLFLPRLGEGGVSG